MAFHPYPGVVPRLFNAGGFGRPRGLTPASPCPGVDHPASRPRPATGGRPVRTRFRCGSPSARPRRRPRLAGSFFNRHAVTERVRSGCLRAHGFRRCFTPLPGCFSPFPHGTRTLSVRQVYSGLPDGPGGFTRDSTSPALLGRHHPWCTRIRLRGHHPLRPGIQPGSPHACIYHHSQRRRPLDRRSHDTMRATPDGYHTRTV